MEEKIDEYKLLFIGFSCHGGDPLLEIGQDVEMIVKGTVQKVEKANNDDGTISITYKIKQTSCQQSNK